MPLSDLMDEIKKSEAFQTQNTEEIERIDERMASLEQVRRVNLNLVARDNRNSEAHTRVDETDQEIAALKKTKSALKRRVRTGVRTRRKRILDARERMLSELDTRLKGVQDQQAELKNATIPDAERVLHDLKERLIQCEEDARRVQREIQDISNHDLDALLPI